MTLVWIVPLALIVGVVLGALGGGGAILTVPILVYVLGHDPKTATAGSLVIVTIASLIGLIPHVRAGHTRVKDGLVFGGVGFAGSVVGSWANHLVAGPVLMSAFAALLFVVAALMTRQRRVRRCAGADVPTPHRKDLATLTAVASGVGLLTGFFGVGGGFAVVPALVLVLGMSMQVAVGTSLVVIVLNSLTALAGRLASGAAIDWPTILTFAVLASAGTLLGSKAARRVDADTLSLAFTVLLVAVAVFVAAQNLPALLG